MASKRYTLLAKEYTEMTEAPNVRGVYYFEKQKDYSATTLCSRDILWESCCTPSRTTDRNMLCC